MCVFKCVYLTAAGFALLVAVNEEVPGALRAEGQQDGLQHSRQQSETQEERPEGGISHNGFNPKDLCNTHSILLTYNTVQYTEHYTVYVIGHDQIHRNIF